MPRYYEDLDIGETYETGGYTVTKEEIIEFAEQFDPQPFHLDEEAAQDSMFGELVASGLHTLCLSVRLFVTEIVNGEVDIANMGGLGMDDLRWHEPVRLGETLRVGSRSSARHPRQADRIAATSISVAASSTMPMKSVMSILSHNIVRRANAPDWRHALAFWQPPQRVIIDWPSRVRASPFLVWDRCSVAERRPTVYVGGSE